MTIKQGDTYWVNFFSAVGSELKGWYPALILQGTHINKTAIGTVVVVEISSNMKLKVLSGNVFLKKGVGGLPKDSVINITQLHTLDKCRLAKRMGSINKEDMINIFFGLDLLFDR